MDRLQKAVARAREKNKGVVINQRKDTFVETDHETARKIHVDDDTLIENRVVSGFSRRSEAQVFKTLRTKILDQMKRNDWQTIAVASPVYNQGKSTVIANLAVAMAMEVTTSVLAVDLDLKRPSLHRVFGLTESKGVTDILQGKAKVSDVMVSPGIKRLTLLPGSGRLKDSSEQMSNPNTIELLDELAARYRGNVVIYGLPSLLDSDDALKIIRNFDCSLLVLKDGGNTAEEITQSIEMMKQTNYLGYVLSMSRLPK